MTLMEIESHSKECPICKGADFIFIDDVTVRPCKCKIQKLRESMLRNCGINMDEFRSKTFESFKTDTEEQNNMKFLAERFVREYKPGNSIGFFGRSGTGKTHICTAIINNLIMARETEFIDIEYFAYRTEMDALQNMQRDAREQRLSKFMNCDILYIDDLFKLLQNKYGDYETEELRIMFEIINHRYMNKKSIIVSSEYELKQIHGIDNATGGRIYEMLNGNGIGCYGANQRLK